MTSTLPNFSASPSAATATAGGVLNSLPTAESALFPGMNPDGAGDFADLLADGQAGVSAMPTVISTAPAESGLPVFAVGAPVITGPVDIALPAVPEPSREELEQAAAFAATVMQAVQPLLVTPELETPEPQAPVSAPEAACPARVEAPALPNGRPFPTELPVQSRLVRTETRPLNPGRSEAAATAPVPAEDVAAPEALPVPTVAASPEQSGPESVSWPAPQTGTTTAAVSPEQSEAAAFSLPNGRAFPTPLPEQAKPLFVRPSEPAPTETAPIIPVEQGSDKPLARPMPSPAPQPGQSTMTIAADGAIECRITLSVARPSEPVAERAIPATEETPLEIQAELEIPGQAVVRVQMLSAVATGHAPVPAPRAVEQGRAAGVLTENFAAFGARKFTAPQERGEATERKILFTGEEKVRADSENGGIAVAKTESAMIAVPTEEIRRPGQTENFSVTPAAVDFQVAQPAAERITAEPVAPAGQNFAERAVAAVTNLAEAQFSASMQRAGSVQLRLKFGGEDLAVRVELRGGLVHTDFRTDSPALREAIATEWQAVAAASPSHLQRFLDPVFSPATPGGTADSGAQHQSSQRQAQQQAQEHAHARHDGWAGHAAFSRRSVLNESFVPAPAVPRVAVMLPTSLRLSALA
ncbi:MAG: hypothetical protein QG602_3949 [Verrucomicrobiota bacterium]|nr:hypothetical protein [Verrucomicrobiota bacterium]